METLRNIKKVSLIFFIVTGLLHLSSSMFIANNFLLKQALILNKTMDIPFILSGLLYGASSLRLNFTDPTKPHKILDIVLTSGIIILLLTLIILNLALPDRYT